MNTVILALQALAALIYGASGVMKVFMFDKIRTQVPSFGALPREGWMFLGIIELVCVIGLVVPVALRQPALAGLAAAVLATESLVVIGVHAKYREIGSIIMCVVLGLLMAFIAYGRLVLKPHV